MTSAMQVTSVKDAPFNAKGDGSADDFAAIQKAVDWTQDRARGHIHFPIGKYRLTRPVTWERPECDIGFLGEPGAEIFGDYPDWLLQRSMKSPIGGVHTIEKLRFVNHHPKGKGVAFHSCVGASLLPCLRIRRRSVRRGVRLPAGGGAVPAPPFAGFLNMRRAI